MARPKKEGMDYFPHDTDAVNDEKIEALRLLYGNDGYAFYFILLERIYRTAEFELDISDAETIQILSRKVGVSVEKFEQMLESALKRKCFDREAYESRKVLTSPGIKNRAGVVVEKRKKMQQRYQLSKNDVSSPVSDEFLPQKPDRNAAESTQSKVKKSKVKKSKYAAIESAFLNLGGGIILNPDDIACINRMAELDVEVEQIISWMKTKHDDFYRKNPNGKISSIKYYEPYVNDMYQKLKSNVVPFSGYRPKKEETLEERWERMKREGKLSFLEEGSK